MNAAAVHTAVLEKLFPTAYYSVVYLGRFLQQIVLSMHNMYTLIQHEMFPFQPQPVSASATSASAICFLTE